jgi:hypothetical protein
VKGKPEHHILNARSINMYKGYMRFLCICFRDHCRRESVWIAECRRKMSWVSPSASQKYDCALMFGGVLKAAVTYVLAQTTDFLQGDEVI